ncbi:MAG: VCBS repeat-containing protein [Myxococcales bacterium]|nr:VCBS repeat-containing protein [Myxococcales bacterium]
MSPHRWRLACALTFLALLGCDDLPAINANGVCGNGVLEPLRGEDCDTFAVAGATCGAVGTPQSCRYICSRTDPNVRCPGGWGCGQDGVCRAPSGLFNAPGSLPLSLNWFGAGDVDGDHYNDLLGISAPTLSVIFGDSSGLSSALAQLPVDAAFGAVRLGDIDADGLVDLVVGSDDLLSVFRGRPSRTMTPLDIPVDAFAIDADESVRLLAGIPTPFGDGRLTVLVIARDGSASIYGIEIDDEFELETETVLPPDMPPPDRLPLRLGRADLTGDGVEELAVAVFGGLVIYIIQVSCDDLVHCEPVIRQQVRMPAGVPVGYGGTFFNDVDGDGVVDLVIGGGGMADVNIALARGSVGEDGEITFANAEPMITDVAIRDRLFTCMACPFPPTEPLEITDLDGDGRADLIGRNGAFSIDPGPPKRIDPLVTNYYPWASAVVGDFNADGITDFAAAGGTHLSIYLGTGAGRFNPFELSYGDSVSRLEIGDFDGDLQDDLLLIGEDSITVLYADGRGVPSVPVEVISGVEIAWATARDEFGALDDIDDLALLERRGGPDQDNNDVVLVEYRGSSSRRMRTGVQLPGVTQQLLLLDQGTPDASVLALTATAADQQVVRAFADELLNDVAPAVRPMTLDDSCGTIASAQVKLAAADLDGDGLDEGLVVESHRPMDLVDISWPVYILHLDANSIACELVGFSPIESPASRLASADFDGDGNLDLLIVHPYTEAFSRPVDAAPWTTGVTVFFGDGAGGFNEEPVVVDLGDYSGEAVPVQLDTDPRMEILVAMEFGPVMLRVAPDDFEIEDLGVEPFPEPRDIAELQTTDLGNDGVPDVLVRTEDQLLILRQQACTAEASDRGDCVRSL